MTIEELFAGLPSGLFDLVLAKLSEDPNAPPATMDTNIPGGNWTAEQCQAVQDLIDAMQETKDNHCPGVVV